LNSRLDSDLAISVAVATHNRPERLGALLRSLEDQTLPSEHFEVVVVDDGSAEATADALAQAKASSRLQLTTFRNEHPRGPAAARDAAWRLCRSHLVVFTDDDCRATPGWLETVIAAHVRDPGAVLQGMTLPDPSETDRIGPFSRTIEVRALDAGFQTCNIAYPKSLLEQIGGFDVKAFDTNPGGEDADLAWRAIKSGATPVFDEDMLVHHAINDLGALGKLRVAARWTTPMAAYVRHPELRRAHFVKQFFWKGSHYLLFRVLVALLLPRRLRAFAPWLAAPYGHELEQRRRTEGAGLLIYPYYLIHDLIECWAIARAAVRFRRPML
jgi:glycosyltransferase involved in cell wall biosynthesis